MPMFRTSHRSTAAARVESSVRDMDYRTTDFPPWSDIDHMPSVADPDTLARVVQAHKTGDAVAQAVLTFALVLAIGTVAIVLSVERAAAAGLWMQGMIDHTATLAAIGVIGATVLFATRSALRQIRVRTRGRRD